MSGQYGRRDEACPPSTGGRGRGESLLELLVAQDDPASLTPRAQRT